MASNIKNFLYSIFLVSPLTLTLVAQNKIEKNINSNFVISKVKSSADHCQKQVMPVNLDDSKQFIVELSIPKDSFAIEAAGIVKSTSNVISENCSKKFATYSALAKDIIENYKYDFSETFIDILFFEDIDLARIRTI